jgi:SET domain-containing protein
MLIYKTYLDKSTIPGAGLGCFASEFIPEGAMIWKFDPEIDRVFESIEEFSEIQKEFLTTYCYMHDSKYYLCVDNARFINHNSLYPNTRESKTNQATYAAKDIQPGEEILSDYSDFGVNDSDNGFNTTF